MSGENVEKPVLVTAPDGRSDYNPPFDFIMTNQEGQTFVGNYKNGGEHAQLVRDDSKWEQCTSYERGDVVRAVHTPKVARWRRFLAYFGADRFFSPRTAHTFIDFECRSAYKFPNYPIIPQRFAKFGPCDEAAPIPEHVWADLPIANHQAEDRLHRPGVQPTRIVEMDFAEIEERLLAMMSDKTLRTEMHVVPKIAALNACGEHYTVTVNEQKFYATVDSDGRADALYAYGGASYRLRDFEQSLTRDEWDSINDQIQTDREWE